MLGQITAYLGLHYAYIQDYPLSRKLLEEALALLESKQTRVEKARANIMLGSIMGKQGELQKSLDLLEQARVALKEEGDIWWYTLSLSALGNRNFSIGKIQESKVFFQEAIQLVDPGDLRLSLPIRDGLANVAYREGDYTEAERLLQENLKLSFQLGFKREIASIYVYLARVMQSTGRFDQAKRYYQECVDLFTELGELCDLATGLIYLGKLLTSCQETETARKKILNAIQIARGETFSI